MTSLILRYFDALTFRTIKVWFHPDFIYKRSNLAKTAEEARSNCFMVLTPEIVKEARKKMFLGTDEKNIVRALIDRDAQGQAGQSGGGAEASFRHFD
jgi:hypothetical protein